MIIIWPSLQTVLREYVNHCQGKSNGYDRHDDQDNQGEPRTSRLPWIF